MTRLMIVVGSVRPGRNGLSIAEWVRDRVAESADIEVDFVDLKELDLPLLDEPQPPALQQYTKPHTFSWSERVQASDAVIFVVPEYNAGYSPAVKNAIDYLVPEWQQKVTGFVSYGMVAAGTRGVAALMPTLNSLGFKHTENTVGIDINQARVVRWPL